jgi:hypothetical protein
MLLFFLYTTNINYQKILEKDFIYYYIIAINWGPITPPTYFFLRKHVNYEEDKNKVPMNKPYNIQNTNICNGIFHISFFKALAIIRSWPGENKRPVASHWKTLSHNVVHHGHGGQHATLVAITTLCIGRCTNYHAIAFKNDDLCILN